MAEQVDTLRTDARERLLVAIRDTASAADPDEVRALAEAWELLTRHA